MSGHHNLAVTVAGLTVSLSLDEAASWDDVRREGEERGESRMYGVWPLRMRSGAGSWTMPFDLEEGPLLSAGEESREWAAIRELVTLAAEKIGPLEAEAHRLMAGVRAGKCKPGDYAWGKACEADADRLRAFVDGKWARALVARKGAA